MSSLSVSVVVVIPMMMPALVMVKLLRKLFGDVGYNGNGGDDFDGVDGDDLIMMMAMGYGD